MDIAAWHLRYLQQANWTRSLRDYLLGHIVDFQPDSILEVGCGTGAIQIDMLNRGIRFSVGFDVSLSSLVYAQNTATSSFYAQGDAHRLPFPNNFFDVVFCHYLFLWVKQPELVLAEMYRTTRPGGFVIAFAEPDYGGKVDFPLELGIINTWQMESLRRQGADPLIGRKLKSLFQSVGLNVNGGILGSEWLEIHGMDNVSNSDLENEWRVIRSDVQVLDQIPSQSELEKIYKLDLAAYTSKQRLSFVPTFYAWSKKN